MSIHDKDKCNEDILNDKVEPAEVEDDGGRQRAEEAVRLLNDLESAAMYPEAEGFVADMVDRSEKWGEDMFCSEGQLDWLRRLHEQYC